MNHSNIPQRSLSQLPSHHIPFRDVILVNVPHIFILQFIKVLHCLPASPCHLLILILPESHSQFSSVLVLCLALQDTQFVLLFFLLGHAPLVILSVPPLSPKDCQTLVVPFIIQRQSVLFVTFCSATQYSATRRGPLYSPLRRRTNAPFNAGNVCLVFIFARRNRVAVRPVCCTKTESVLH